MLVAHERRCLATHSFSVGSWRARTVFLAVKRFVSSILELKHTLGSYNCEGHSIAVHDDSVLALGLGYKTVRQVRVRISDHSIAATVAGWGTVCLILCAALPGVHSTYNQGKLSPLFECAVCLRKSPAKIVLKDLCVPLVGRVITDVRGKGWRSAGRHKRQSSYCTCPADQTPIMTSRISPVSSSSSVRLGATLMLVKGSSSESSRVTRKDLVQSQGRK
jgi:hypothetical protein